MPPLTTSFLLCATEVHVSPFVPCLLMHTRPSLPPFRESARFPFCERSIFHSFHAQGRLPSEDCCSPGPHWWCELARLRPLQRRVHEFATHAVLPRTSRVDESHGLVLRTSLLLLARCARSTFVCPYPSWSWWLQRGVHRPRRSFRSVRATACSFRTRSRSPEGAQPPCNHSFHPVSAACSDCSTRVGAMRVRGPVFCLPGPEALYFRPRAPFLTRTCGVSIAP